jgi:hypothetical protein
MRLLFSLVRLPVKISLDLAGRAVSAVFPAETETPAGAPAPPPPPAPRPRRASPSRPNGAAPPARPAPPPVPAEPAHVSEEPELVAEVAEQGAEEGAGAEVHVDPPWAGYDEMSAADIRDRLQAEDASVAAAVTLYEASRKGRSSVLETASRRTASARPSG